MFNNKYKSIFTSIFLFSAFYFLLSIPFSSAVEAPTLQVKFPCPKLGNIPCPAEESLSPAAYIARFYQLALAIAGMLAFGMIIFGAIHYTVSAGNVTQQSDARDRIFQALWGVALLLGAYLILYTINPGLVNLKDPNIKEIAVPVEEGEGKPCKGDIYSTDCPYNFICWNGKCHYVKPKEKEGGPCKIKSHCEDGLDCQNDICTLSEETKEKQKSGEYRWVKVSCDFLKGKSAYPDNRCPPPKPTGYFEFVCCGRYIKGEET